MTHAVITIGTTGQPYTLAKSAFGGVLWVRYDGTRRPPSFTKDRAEYYQRYLSRSNAFGVNARVVCVKDVDMEFAMWIAS